MHQRRNAFGRSGPEQLASLRDLRSVAVLQATAESIQATGTNVNEVRFASVVVRILYLVMLCAVYPPGADPSVLSVTVFAGLLLGGFWLINRIFELCRP